MDGLELLRKDHDEVRGLFKEFRSASESEDAGRMGELCTQIFQELKVHTAIEEEVFYPAIHDAGGKELAETTDESYEEHHVVDVLMGEIEKLAPGESAFVAKMKVLMENVEHHAKEEEEEMFPEVRKLMSEDQLQTLGADLEAAKKSHKMKDASKEELQEKAKQLDIEGRSSMTKDELTKEIQRQSAS